MSSQEITLKIPQEVVVELMKKVFKEEYKENMSEVLVSVLHNNTHALETILKATMGIIPKTKYKVGDIISINCNSVASWRFDETEMESRGYTSNGHLKVTIESINVYSIEPYTVRYNYWSKDEQRDVSDTYNLNEYSVIGLAEEYPLEL
tara:strand:+ start:906 stop:1352 length:447 start_codon:yes stop_codon:yes gene_type:complete